MGLELRHNKCKNICSSVIPSNTISIYFVNWSIKDQCCSYSQTAILERNGYKNNLFKIYKWMLFSIENSFIQKKINYYRSLSLFWNSKKKLVIILNYYRQKNFKCSLFYLVVVRNSRNYVTPWKRKPLNNYFLFF